MNIKKIDLPNPGVIEAKLNQEQIDALWLHVHKYASKRIRVDREYVTKSSYKFKAVEYER